MFSPKGLRTGKNDVEDEADSLKDFNREMQNNATQRRRHDNNCRHSLSRGQQQKNNELTHEFARTSVSVQAFSHPSIHPFIQPSIHRLTWHYNQRHNHYYDYFDFIHWERSKFRVVWGTSTSSSG